MPRQLRNAKRSRRSTPRLIVENLPSIAVKDLKIPSIYDRKSYVKSLLFPSVASITVSSETVDFHHRPMHRGQLGDVQSFKVARIKTGTGYRNGLYCSCGRRVMKMYYHSYRVACRRCHQAVFASQRRGGKHQRLVLQATRIADLLDNQKLYKRTRERLIKKLGQKAMRAQTRMGTHVLSILKTIAK
jgi:hypothetical protein